jgi:integrase/recombinase XerD
MAGRPKGSGGQAKELSREEIKRIDQCLGKTVHELRNRALFFLGLGSGMRIAEMCQLLISDIVSLKKRIEILPAIVLEKHSTKSKRSRTVYISKQANLALRNYLESRSHLQEKDPLFPSQMNRNQSLKANTAIITLSKMFKAAGIRHASSHSLRRTHANALRRNGVDLKIIQEQLGHSSLATTERYFQVDPIETRKAVEGLKF